MNVNYEFADMIGSSYKNGNVSFVNNQTLASSIGNKVKVFNIRENNSWTLPVESSFSLHILEIAPSGKHAFAVNEFGRGLFINLVHGTVLYRMYFGAKVQSVKFSPDGKKLAVITEGTLNIYRTAFQVNSLFRPFALLQIRRLTTDTLRTLSWSHDSQLVVAGGDDRRLWVTDATKKLANITALGIPAHHYAIVGCYFYNKGTLDLISVDERGVVFAYDSNIKPQELEKKSKSEEANEEVEKLFYTKQHKEKLSKHLEGPAYELKVTAATYNEATKTLTVGYAHGVFLILEVPSCNVIQSMRASELRIRSLAMNTSGDWLAIGCGQGSQTQLIVWEWHSESYVLKQQSHSQKVLAAVYSPDGSMLATGAEDGKVKIWNVNSSMCVVTFSDHTAGVSALSWTQNGKAIVSASMDGTIRCHDMKRYRNFRTMTTPKPTQLGCVVIDDASELIVASSRELFEIYVFTMDTGDMVDTFSGHSSLISAIAISGSNLATVSLDRTMRVFNVVDQSQSEGLNLVAEGLDVKFSKCGKLLAALTFDSCISLFDAKTRQEIGTIDTRLDVDASRLAMEQVKKTTSTKNRSFTCIAFSPDTKFIIAGGQSNFVGLYSVEHRMLLRKFVLTLNKSLDGVRLDIDYRKISEFGNMEDFESSDEEADHIRGTNKTARRLPGTAQSDMGERSYFPVMRVNAVDFNPTCRSFAVVSTEGIATYSLDSKRRFDPFQLALDVTPQAIRDDLEAGLASKALSNALRLGDLALIKLVIVAIPWDRVKFIVGPLDVAFIERLLKHMANDYTTLFGGSVNLFHCWLSHILHAHGQVLKNDRKPEVLTAVTALQHIVTQQMQQVFSPLDEATATLDYLMTVRKLKKIEVFGGDKDDDDIEVIDLDDDDD